MGGKALKNTYTKRINRLEFDTISSEIINVISKTFIHFDIPVFFKNKESFGDIDIIVSTTNINADIREYIINNFAPNEIFHNGNCWSFDYKETQVDLIITDDKHFRSTLQYMGNSDLGNMVGRLAHALGLKYGQNGLCLNYRFKGSSIGEIIISEDYPKILNFLGLSHKRFEEGFDELEDIFEFVAQSPYFNWKKFQLVELNKINRDRNKKRASYLSLLAWIDKNVADENHEFEFVDDKSIYFELINKTFPEANMVRQIRGLEYLECKKLYIQAKFNGGDIMRTYGLEGKKLGDKINGFKAYISLNRTFDEYIIQTDMTEIYQDFETYLKNSVYEKD